MELPALVACAQIFRSENWPPISMAQPGTDPSGHPGHTATRCRVAARFHRWNQTKDNGNDKSWSDTPAAGTSTQRTGEVEEFGGETLPLDPWAHQGMEISDRPTILPITHDPNISDKVMYLQMAFKQRPLRDGGGKPSLGRLAPWARPLSKAAVLGARICVLTSPWGSRPRARRPSRSGLPGAWLLARSRPLGSWAAGPEAWDMDHVSNPGG